jgi:magnesium-transporting ATPase (P-type)
MNEAHDTDERRWHALDAHEVLERLRSDPEGLSSAEASARLERDGPNALPSKRRVGPLRRFARQFQNVLIYILVAAAVGTALLQMWLDTGVILAVVVINAAIGFVQEGKAEKALEAIAGMLAPKALVRRDGRRQKIGAETLVVGDIVHLGAGDRVPADLRLIETKNLRVDEAVLTGESQAVDKGVPRVDPEADLGDRVSMAFSGTFIAAGTGKGVVMGTGRHTELGHISQMVGEVEKVETPLLKKTHQFGQWLSVVIVLLAGVTFAFGYWVQGYALQQVFLAAVSLAVAAIPEGLPAIMTVTLAIGVQKMAARNAIIRRLPAVETLGSVGVIYSDKTGTLTRNEMTLKSILTAEKRLEVSGVGYEPRGGFTHDGHDIEPERDDRVSTEALRAGLLCNDACVRQKDDVWVLEGEPTEGALVTAALKAGFDQKALEEQYPRIDVIPFDSEHKFMATLHHDHEGHAFIYLKGAPERVLQMCERARRSDGDAPLDREHWKGVMEAVASEGRRVLAVATKDVPKGTHQLEFGDVEGDMTLLALVGIIDPPREEAITAVEQCQQAGIQVKMITGDHELTARAVAEELGIDTRGGVITGRELAVMSSETLQREVDGVDVFARASPEHKLRLVEALQAKGKVVAMTGDGVNDAPALKRADIGVAMGVKGTEVAKEASEMVLADDDFATIARAVEAGRAVYDNLIKTILFLLPTNGGQAFTIIAAIFSGLALPLSPVQVLWVNMVTAVTLAMALAFEPAESGVMKRKPRAPDEPILSGFLLWRIAFVSILLVAGTFGHFLWAQFQGQTLAQSRMVAINTLVAGQLFYLFNSRFVLESSLRKSAFLGSRAVLVAVAVLVVLQGAFTYLGPLQTLFDTAPPAAGEWGRILAFGVVVFAAVELEKAILRRWRKDGG